MHGQVSQLYHVRYLAGSDAGAQDQRTQTNTAKLKTLQSMEQEPPDIKKAQQDNPKHLEDEGEEWHLEASEDDGLHDGLANPERQEQQRYAGRREKQEQGVVQVPYTKSGDLVQDDSHVQDYLESARGYGKMVTEVKEHSQVSQLYQVRYLAGAEGKEHSQVSQLYQVRYLAGSEEKEHSQVSQLYQVRYLAGSEEKGHSQVSQLYHVWYLAGSEVKEHSQAQRISESLATLGLQEQQDIPKEQEENGLHRNEAIDGAIDTHSHIQTGLHRDEARNSTEQSWTTGLHKDEAIDEAIDTHSHIQNVLHRDEAIDEAIELGGTTELHKDKANDEATDEDGYTHSYVHDIVEKYQAKKAPPDTGLKHKMDKRYQAKRAPPDTRLEADRGPRSGAKRCDEGRGSRGRHEEQPRGPRSGA